MTPQRQVKSTIFRRIKTANCGVDSRSCRDMNEGIAGLGGLAIIILCHLNRSFSGLLLYENERISTVVDLSAHIGRSAFMRMK